MEKYLIADSEQGLSPDEIREALLFALEGRKIRKGHIFVTESGEVPEETVAELTALIREKTGAAEVHHTIAGCTVSSHCGPKTLGVLFIEE